MERTTDLEVIRQRKAAFTWGKILAIHDVGPAYTIVEFVRRDDSKTSFHAYVDGKDTCQGASNLEGALLIAIARKHLEANEARYMAIAAAKLFGIKETG